MSITASSLPIDKQQIGDSEDENRHSDDKGDNDGRQSFWAENVPVESSDDGGSE